MRHRSAANLSRRSVQILRCSGQTPSAGRFDLNPGAVSVSPVRWAVRAPTLLETRTKECFICVSLAWLMAKLPISMGRQHRGYRHFVDRSCFLAALTPPWGFLNRESSIRPALQAAGWRVHHAAWAGTQGTAEPGQCLLQSFQDAAAFEELQESKLMPCTSAAGMAAGDNFSPSSPLRGGMQKAKACLKKRSQDLSLRSGVERWGWGVGFRVEGC